MSNIIKGVDFGMGYTKAGPGDERRIDVSHWDAEDKKWVRRWHESLTQDMVTGFDSFRVSFKGDGPFRRPLPILANHPEAIPLEPGEVLQVGDRGLTRDGRDTGELVENTGNSKSSHHLRATLLGESFMTNGKNDFADRPESEFDIIARLPKVAKEAEKAKEEKVSSSDSWLNVGKWKRYEHYGVSKVEIPPSEAARLYLENESVRAEVQRQEEAKRIGPGDWVSVYGGPIFKAKQYHDDQITGDWVSWFKPEQCRKITDPDLIAALNTEIDGKAGG